MWLWEGCGVVFAYHPAETLFGVFCTAQIDNRGGQGDAAVDAVRCDCAQLLAVIDHCGVM